MSKIICEICGTAYPEASTQCPICGFVRSAEAAAVAVPETDEENSRNYTYVKGGRFSKSNVKKRSRANQKPDRTAKASTSASNRGQKSQPKKKKKNVGVIVISIILLLLVLAFVLFLVYKLFLPALPEVTPEETPSSQQTDPAETVIACTGITLDATEVTLNEVGAARMIYATPSPANTTDTLEFESSDDTVVTVSDIGKIVAVGPGQAAVTVKCGDIQVSCTVICQIETEPDDPTDEPTDATTEATEDPTISLDDFKAKKKDITFFNAGEKFTLYSGDIDVSLITWTSDNEAVATIKNGVITAVGKGKTEVHGEINGVVITCIVRCNFQK